MSFAKKKQDQKSEPFLDRGTMLAVGGILALSVLAEPIIRRFQDYGGTVQLLILVGLIAAAVTNFIVCTRPRP